MLEMRLDRGLTQADLAHDMGVSVGSISRAERSADNAMTVRNRVFWVKAIQRARPMRAAEWAWAEMAFGLNRQRLAEAGPAGNPPGGEDPGLGQFEATVRALRELATISETMRRIEAELRGSLLRDAAASPPIERRNGVGDLPGVVRTDLRVEDRNVTRYIPLPKPRARPITKK